MWPTYEVSSENPPTRVLSEGGCGGASGLGGGHTKDLKKKVDQ